MTGISITKQIYSILSGDDELKKLVGNKIYPLIAEETTTFPFLIIRRNSLTPNYGKFQLANDLVSFSVGIASTTYDNAITIAERVRYLLEIKLDNSHIEGITEDYVDNTYIEEISFSLIINKSDK